jgi:hypothetical protein
MKDNFISIRDVSEFCEVDVSVLEEWSECGLITIEVLENAEGIHADEIRDVKRVARLYRELGVNREGMEIIAAMRNRILEMSRELDSLRHEIAQRKAPMPSLLT